VSSSGSITPLPLDPELFGELLEKVPAEVIEQLTDNWRKQTEALARSQKENRLLRELLRLMRMEKYGPASERLSDEQLELLEQEPGVSQAEVQTESERAQLQLPLKGPKQRPVRQALPAELPRIEQLIACEPQECVCGACGQEKVVIGYEMAEQLDVEPAKYFVRVTKREKTSLSPLSGTRGSMCATTAPDYREEFSQRSAHHRDDRQQICRLCAVISAERHLRTGHGAGTVSSHAVWLGHARWRTVAAHQSGNGQGTFGQ